MVKQDLSPKDIEKIESLLEENAALKGKIAELSYDCINYQKELKSSKEAYSILVKQIEERAVLRHIQYGSVLSYRLWEYRLMENLARWITGHTTYPLGKLRQHSPRKLKFKNLKFQKQKVWPSIAISTPSYNQAHFLERTINSVLNQNYPNLNYSVQDGFSKDNTVEVLKKYSGKLIWVSEKDKGQAHAINKGFNCVSGDIMGYLNSDDMLAPGALFVIADYFARHPEVDVVYGHRYIIDENDDEVGRWYMPNFDKDEIRYVDYIPQETMFWRRSIWEKSGGCIDESLHHSIDWDLILRFKASGARFARIPQFLGLFRVHNEQKTFKMMEDIASKENMKLRKREFGRYPLEERICYFSHLAMLKSFLHQTCGPIF